MYPHSLAGSQPNDPILQNSYIFNREKYLINRNNNEKIPYHDCIYKNLNRLKKLSLKRCPDFFVYSRFEYIVILDTDEIIVPIKHNNWKDMMREIRTESDQQNVGGWSFKSFYFVASEKHNKLSNISEIMSKTMRYSRQKNVKSILNINNVREWVTYYH